MIFKKGTNNILAKLSEVANQKSAAYGSNGSFAKCPLFDGFSDTLEKIAAQMASPVVVASLMVVWKTELAMDC